MSIVYISVGVSQQQREKRERGEQVEYVHDYGYDHYH